MRKNIKKVCEAKSILRAVFGVMLLVIFALVVRFYNGENGSAAGNKTTDGGMAVARAPSISAQGAVLVEGETGDILFQYQAEKRLFPASTTKIMTALVALDICEEQNVDLKGFVLIPEAAVGQEGSSLYLKEGEKMSVEDLLYGMMLHSGNDSAETLAWTMTGNREVFIERMNQMAEDLGCKDTHFTNPSGLPDQEHYTTAYDLAIISRKALENPTFQSIVKSKQWKTEDETRTFENKNKTVFQYDGGDGVKIGYTKASGRTLVASATREEKQLIAVVLNDGNWFQDAYSMLDYGFSLLGVNVK